MAPRKKTLIEKGVDIISNIGESADEREQARQNKLRADFESRQVAPTETPQETAKPLIRERDTGAIEKEKFNLIQQGATEKQANASVLQQREFTGQGVATPQSLTLQQAQANAEALKRSVGATNPLITQDIQNAPIDISQALASGVATAGPGVIGGAVAGSIAPGIGNVVGAIAGGIGGFATGVRNNIKSQRTGEISAVASALPDNEKNLRRLVALANSDPINADLYFSQFNEQLSYIERDYGRLNLQVKSNVNKFSGVDGTPVLADYERFLRANGGASILTQNMLIALQAPNPQVGLTSLNNPELQ